MLKVKGWHKEKYLANKMVLSLNRAFRRNFCVRANGDLEENKSTEKIYNYIYQVEINRYQTYRKLRFNMYLEVMKDANAALDNKENLKPVFKKWSGLCSEDMTRIEKDYIEKCVKNFINQNAANGLKDNLLVCVIYNCVHIFYNILHRFCATFFTNVFTHFLQFFFLQNCL